MSLSKHLRALRYATTRLDRFDKAPTGHGVIVSLTTLPSRVGQLKPTLVSLLKQTRPPDVIEINLAKTPCRPDIPWKIPKWLGGLKVIQLCWLDHDYGPASKFIPTLQRHQHEDRLIVIVDDDMLYGNMLLESLITADQQANGNTVFCANGHPITKNLVFFDHPSDASIHAGQRRVAIIEGCGGYCIRPQYFDLPTLIDTGNAPDGAHIMDDIWISGHLSRRGIPKFQIPTGKRKSLPQSEIPAIVGDRTEASDALLHYFKDDWEAEELVSDTNLINFK